jgi:dipeptidase E
MKKLLLTSAGFYTPEIADKCESLVGKPKKDIRFAIINEAYAVEHDNHGWVLDDLNRLQKSFGGWMEFVNLLALEPKEIRSRIEKIDVIYVEGGHTDYLMSVFIKSGFSNSLRELLETKVYVGSSAGSMVAGKRLSESAYNTIYGSRETYGTDQYLGIVDFAMLPHLNSPDFPSRKELFVEAAEDHPGMVYGLSDDTAFVIEGDTTYSIGSNPVKIVDGKLA